jgi:serine phosphatase RsbU (regulator of sigma subunit)/tetratricopeptide (TPR) repeat protein
MNICSFFTGCILISSLFFSKAESQNRNVIDSLNRVIKTAKHDSIKIKTLLNLANELYLSNPDTTIIVCQHALSIAQKISNKKAIGDAYGWLGYLVSIKGDLHKASEYYNNSLKIRKEIGDKQGIALSLNNLGYTYRVQGNIPKALEYYGNSLKIFESINDKPGIAEAYNNLSSIYFYIGDTIKSLEYHKKCLTIYENIGDKHGIATTLLWFGYIYKNKGNRDKALEYFNRSLKIQNEIGDKYGIATTFNNIGVIFENQHDNLKALDYYNKSLAIREEIHDNQGIAYTLVNIASISLEKNDVEKALNYGIKAYKISKELGYIDNIERASGVLKHIYEKRNDFKKAFQYFKEERLMHDSVENKDNFKKAQKQQARYEYDKKAAVDSIAHSKEIQIKNLEINRQTAVADRQRIAIWFVVSGLLFVLGFLFILFRMFVQKKKANHLLAQQNIEIRTQKEEISTQRDEIRAQRDTVTLQKDHIEEIHKKITDSINYAKRIQEAVLPMSDTARSILGEHFILFKPKDIVSGDFYWATQINEWLIVAVADCTGHGVPGAFMSMLGISFLNEIVRKKEITKSNQVLNELRKEVINALQQRGVQSEQKDGMDIVLIAINKTTMQCQFSGANNPLYVVKKFENLKMCQFENEPSSSNQPISSSTHQLIEYKGDKMPVAIHPVMNDFTYNEFQLEQGDILYLFSDGYADQFGGEQGKKFLYKRFKELIITNAGKPMNEQKQALDNSIIQWIGNGEQTDDITVVGIKI